MLKNFKMVLACVGVLLSFGQLKAQNDTIEKFPRGLHDRVWNAQKWWSYRKLGVIGGVHNIYKPGFEAGISISRVRGSYQGGHGRTTSLMYEAFPFHKVDGVKLNVYGGIAVLIAGVGIGVNGGYYRNYSTGKYGMVFRPETGFWLPGFSIKYGMNIHQVQRLGIPRHVFTLNVFWSLIAPEKPIVKEVIKK